MQDRLMSEVRDELIPSANAAVERSQGNRAARRRAERDRRRRELRDAVGRVEAEQRRRSAR